MSATPLSFSVDLVVDGKLQFTAGMWFLEHSQLVEWDKSHHEFRARGGFEDKARQLDAAFGRVACWTSFSIGAEYLLKGLLLAKGTEIRDQKKTYAVPPQDRSEMQKWCRRMRRPNKQHPEIARPDLYAYYDTLGGLTAGKLRPFLAENTPQAGTSKEVVDQYDQDADMVYAALELLANMIRNRDAHAYVPNVRSQHEWLVSSLFVPAFNVMLRWMPDSAKEIGHRYRVRAQLVKDSSRAIPDSSAI
jgi:hypothetical protein